jgi:hypothetical protein
VEEAGANPKLLFGGMRDFDDCTLHIFARTESEGHFALLAVAFHFELDRFAGRPLMHPRAKSAWQRGAVHLDDHIIGAQSGTLGGASLFDGGDRWARPRTHHFEAEVGAFAGLALKMQAGAD